MGVVNLSKVEMAVLMKRRGSACQCCHRRRRLEDFVVFQTELDSYGLGGMTRVLMCEDGYTRLKWWASGAVTADVMQEFLLVRPTKREAIRRRIVLSGWKPLVGLALLVIYFYCWVLFFYKEG